jgi:2-methylcitrate dehydratase PrpD
VREHQLEPESVLGVDVTVTPPVFRLVGHDFEIGNNPTVDAQFNLRYCIANGLLRKSSALVHFDAAAVSDPRIGELTRRIDVHEDRDLNEGRRDLSARAIMRVKTLGGEELVKIIDHPSGFPPNELTTEQHLARFWDNVNYAGKPLRAGAVETLVSRIDRLEDVEDVRALIPLLISDAGEPAGVGAASRTHQPIYR